MNMKRTEPPPPTCYQKTFLTPEIEEAFSSMRKILNDCTTVLENQDGLTIENYVLSRMLYKLNSQWRKEKSFQGLKRIFTCINRYKELNMIDYVKQLKDHLDGCDLYLGEIYLPSQLMIVYLLRKLVCFACLMSRLCEYCQHTFVYLSQNLAIGHFIPQNMVFISMVSRIWALGRSLTLHSAKWYDTIYNLLHVFPKTQVEADREDLPENLKEFLNLDETGTNSSIRLVTADRYENKNTLPDTDENKQDIPDSSKIQSPILRKKMDDKLTDNFVVTSYDNDMEEDLGCSVSRREIVSYITVNNTDHGLSDRKTKNISKKDNELCKAPVNHDDDSMATLKQKIQNSTSFKTFKEILIWMENVWGKTEHSQECSKKLKQLRKEHLFLKRNGKVNKQFIHQARGEILKLVELLGTAVDNVENEHHNRKTKTSNNRDITKKTKTVGKQECNDICMTDIFKRPYKSLMNLISEQQANKHSVKQHKKKVKKCAMKITCLRKDYLLEKNLKKKKKCIKKAKTEVVRLLESVS